MAAGKGRSLVLKKGGVAIAGIQTKAISYAGEAIDITSDDDSGYRTLLSSPGIETLDISGDGVTKNTTLRALSLNSGGTTQASDWSIEFPNGDTITGNFNLTSYEENGTHNDAVKFSLALSSSGAWTYTAA